MRNTRRRTFNEVVAAQDLTEMARSRGSKAGVKGAVSEQLGRLEGVGGAAGNVVAPEHESHDRSVNRSGGTHSCYRAVPSWSAHQPRLYTRTDYQPNQRVLEKRTRRAKSQGVAGGRKAAQ